MFLKKHKGREGTKGTNGLASWSFISFVYFSLTLFLAACAETPSGMVYIPGGTFAMGSVDPKSRSDENPPHRVRVDGFGWMSTK